MVKKLENIYKTIVYIDRFWDKMDSQERRDFIEQIISEVNIFEEGGEASGTGKGLSGTSALYRTKCSDHRDRESDAQGRPVCKGRTAAGNLPVRIRDQAG